MTDQEVYDQLKDQLVRFAVALVGPDDAPDLVADAVVATIRKRSLASLENPRSYLMTAVLNGARSRGRRHRRERLEQERQAIQVTDAREESVDNMLDVATAVRRLPIQQRAAVYLTYWIGLASDEAAQQMGVRPATLRRYLVLARQSLRRYLDE
ncbi:MAG TPA: RNA polymerase sigma factor [Acidimicrobiia bacterium]